MCSSAKGTINQRSDLAAHQVVCCECNVGPLRQDDRIARAERKRVNRDRKDGLLVAAILDLYPELPVGKAERIGPAAGRLARFGRSLGAVHDDRRAKGTF